MPDPNQDAVVAGNTTATDAEVGMEQSIDDRRAAEEAGIDPDTGHPNTAGGVGGAGG